MLMGTSALSRRDFFRTLTVKQNPGPDDPLFEKYSRKTLGPRVYSNELVSSFRHGAEPEGNGGTTLRVGNITSTLAPYTGTWTEREAIHLIRRTTFGFKKSDVTALAAMTVTDAVNSILTIDTTAPAPPVNWYNNLAVDAGGIAYGADVTNHAFTTSTAEGQTSNHYRMDGLRRWMTGLAIGQSNTIREKMHWFWYHFIPIDFESIFQSSNSYINVNSARIFYQYMKLFRDNALGNFRTLIRNVATQPAMMFYLNNQANSATAPDENFARELMELFTLGKDPLSQYTQDDVVAAAKVLTGWRVQNMNALTTVTNFVSGSHKTGPKQFSPFFNNTIINRTVVAEGALELDDLLNMIFSKTQVVSEYICRRIYRYFVYYDIDANIESNIITPLAQIFVASGWDIKVVLDKLLKSEHFFDVANRGVYIKSPYDLVLGSLRSFNITANVSDATNYEAQYRVWGWFNDSACLPMEQQMGSIPNVSGWNAYYQTPAYHEYWINTNTIQKRFTFLQQIFNGFNLTYNTVTPLTTNIKVDVIAFAQQFANTTVRDPNLLVAECIKYLLPVDLSLDQRNSIKQSTLLYQQITDAYWTTAWDNYFGAPTNTSYKNIVTDRLKNLLYTIVQLAEYQLM
jgi:uncharacterized protein (DUF1800 family)